MNVPELQAKVRANVWQAVAQSKLDLSSIPRETLEALVDLTVEAALLEIDRSIDTSLTGSTTRASEAGNDLTDMDDIENETILWQGRPLLSISTRYVITDDRVRIVEGLLGRTYKDIELVRIQDVSQKQSVGERLLNVGDVTILSHDSGEPTFVLENVRNSQEVYETLRRAILKARKRHNFSYREEM